MTEPDGRGGGGGGGAVKYVNIGIKTVGTTLATDSTAAESFSSAPLEEREGFDTRRVQPNRYQVSFSQ